jgi:hypothetical protein
MRAMRPKILEGVSIRFMTQEMDRKSKDQNVRLNQASKGRNSHKSNMFFRVDNHVGGR